MLRRPIGSVDCIDGGKQMRAALVFRNNSKVQKFLRYLMHFLCEGSIKAIENVDVVCASMEVDRRG